ncbi:MAG: biotin--[acetyl-CoA-carboxylase] ligase [Bacteroidales bacterium]
MNVNLFTKNIITLDEIDSTNSYAEKIISKNKPPEGTIILAKKQNKGRGLDKNKWESEDYKNLIFSIIIYPTFLKIYDQFLITIFISLAIKDFLQELIPEEKVSIKWPNDIYVHNKKICGILIQNASLGENLNQSIVGVGININQEHFISDAPNPISLKNISNQNYDLNFLIAPLSEHLQKRYLEIQDIKQLENIKNEYLNNLYKINTPSKFIVENNEKTGIIKGIDEFGRLEIRFDNQTEAFDLKEVKFVIKGI